MTHSYYWNFLLCELDFIFVGEFHWDFSVNFLNQNAEIKGEPNKRIIVSYIQDMWEITTSLSELFRTSVEHKVTKSLQPTIHKPKDEMLTEESPDIYEIKRPSCKKHYIGQGGGPLLCILRHRLAIEIPWYIFSYINTHGQLRRHSIGKMLRFSIEKVRSLALRPINNHWIHWDWPNFSTN